MPAKKRTSSQLWAMHLAAPATLGYCHLETPYVFQPSGDDAKEDDKEKDKGSKPKYTLKMLFDKKRDAEAIKEGVALQQSIIDQMIADKKWSKQKGGMLAFLDCDNDETTIGDEITTLTEFDPRNKGKYQLSAKSANRPTMYYLDERGMRHKMPKPIAVTEDSTEEEKAKAQEIADFWADKVYPGQYAIAVVEFSGWMSPSGQGVRAELKMVVIVGGGTPLGTINFEDVFTDDEMAELAAWRDANAADAVADAIGSAEEEDKPVERVKKRTKKAKAPEPVEADEDDEDEDEDDDPDWDD